MKEEKYTVWVGGIEVNDHYLTKQEARELTRTYKQNGYEDAVMHRTKK